LGGRRLGAREHATKVRKETRMYNSNGATRRLPMNCGHHIGVVLALMTYGGVAAAQSSNDSLVAPTQIPAGYVRTPGGWTHPSCIHEVPNGATVDAQSGDVTMNGTLIAHHDPCPFAPIPASRIGLSATPGGPASFGGWVEDTVQLAPASQTFDL